MIGPWATSGQEIPIVVLVQLISVAVGNCSAKVGNGRLFVRRRVPSACSNDGLQAGRWPLQSRRSLTATRLPFGNIPAVWWL
jgi:hypothetical protein